MLNRLWDIIGISAIAIIVFLGVWALFQVITTDFVEYRVMMEQCLATEYFTREECILLIAD